MRMGFAGDRPPRYGDREIAGDRPPRYGEPNGFRFTRSGSGDRKLQMGGSSGVSSIVRGGQAPALR